MKWTPLGRYGASAPMRPGTATITQIPKSLPLIPSHLSHTSPTAVCFTGTGGGGCVAMLADGTALAVLV